MQNRAMEIHDSDLDGVSISGHEAALHFSAAYIHQSSGTPGVDAGSGWIQQAVLRIGGATIHKTPSILPIALLGGYIKLDGVTVQDLIPIPFSHTGIIDLRFKSWNDEFILINGTSVELELIGEPKYVEEFPG